MITEDRKYEFGELLKGFREHYLELGISEFCRVAKIHRSQLYDLEHGKRKLISVDLLILLVDMNFPFHRLKDDATGRNVGDCLIMDRFKKHLNHPRSKKLKFKFDVFCELNKEYIEENYIPGVLVPFHTVLECFGNGREE